jgi:ferredoxin-NADP reductase
MKEATVKIKTIEPVTHDVLRITTEKPELLSFTPGQAAEISINKSGWLDQKRPFTFTCLPENDYLEFTIKTYPSHKGVTNQLNLLNPGDELILHDVFGAIHYKGEGVFIAGGAGVTPFISIFRFLQSTQKTGKNKLIFANKTKADIILEEEFKTLLGKNFINILSDENAEGYANGQITEEFLKANSGGTDQLFYLCGPKPMMEAVEQQLEGMYVKNESIIKEAI